MKKLNLRDLNLSQNDINKFVNSSIDVERDSILFIDNVNVEKLDRYVNDALTKNAKKIFTNKDMPNPQDAYSISKFEAEKALWEIASKNGLEVVIVRLPLVYGYGVKGNLERLKTLIYSGIPLPLKLVNNKRSLIGIDNLIEAFHHYQHPLCMGVQWHPEFLITEFDKSIIKLFTDHAKNNV